MATTKKLKLKPLPGPESLLSGLGGAGLSAAGSVVSSGLNALFQGLENQRERNWQEDMYALQLQHNREDATTAFNRQKELIEDERKYQSVGAQVERAQKAGINPLAALGVSSGGGYSSVSPSSPASVGSPNTRAPQVGNFLGSAVEGYSQGAQIENIEADTKLKESQARLTSSKARISEIDEINAKTISDLKVEGMQLENEERKVNTQFTQLQAAQSAASFGLQMEKLNAEIFSLHASGMRQVSAAKTDDATRDAKVAQLWSVTRLNLEKGLTEGVQRGYIKASTDKVVAETELIGFQKLLTMSQAELNSTLSQLNLTENEIKSVDADITKANKEWRTKNERRQGNMKLVTGYLDSASNLVKNVALCVGSVGVGKVLTRTQTTTNLATLYRADGSILSKTDQIILK